MSRNGRTPKPLIPTSEEIAAQAEQKPVAASDQGTQALNYPEYLAHYEMWAAAEPSEAPKSRATASVANQGPAGAVANTGESRELVKSRGTTSLSPESLAEAATGVPRELLVEENYVWIGDDLAVRIEGWQTESAKDIETALSDAEPSESAEGPEWDAQPDIADEPPPAWYARVSPRSYAVGAAALGLILLIGVPGLFSVARLSRDSSAVFDTSQMIAGSDPSNELSDDAITTLVIIPEPEHESLAARNGFRPGRAEEKIREALADLGFTDVGVSASHSGDVYLAANVYSLGEARNIVRVARHALPSARIHFLHPDVHRATGPAYFGVTTESAPDVWGAKVVAVAIGSPAFKAGLRPGDTVREFDHEIVPDAAALDRLVEKYEPGDRVEVRVWRDGGNQFMIARLTELTEMASR